MRHATIAMLALAAMPAIALAQDSSNAGGQRQSAPQTSADSNRAMQAQTQGATSEAKPAVMPARQQSASSQGRRSSGSRGASTGTLSRENIAQLQTALSGAGCDAGTADGIMGPRTRRALACARQKNNVSSDAELYQSLNLDFAPSTGAVNSSGRSSSGAYNSSNGALPQQNTQGAGADAAGAAATHGDSSQVGGTNRGRVRPPADSTHHTSTTPPRHD